MVTDFCHNNIQLDYYTVWAVQAWASISLKNQPQGIRQAIS